jgi:hypothetical protein
LDTSIHLSISHIKHMEEVNIPRKTLHLRLELNKLSSRSGRMRVEQLLCSLLLLFVYVS